MTQSMLLSCTRSIAAPNRPLVCITSEAEAGAELRLSIDRGSQSILPVIDIFRSCFSNGR